MHRPIDRTERKPARLRNAHRAPRDAWYTVRESERVLFGYRVFIPAVSQHEPDSANLAPRAVDGVPEACRIDDEPDFAYLRDGSIPPCTVHLCSFGHGSGALRLRDRARR